MEFQPGKSWKYSNTGYNLLGYIIENVSGISYWDFLRERILAPLGMNATADRNPGAIITNRVSGCEQTNRLQLNRDYDVTDVFSAGAMVSTLGVLTKWHGGQTSGFSATVQRFPDDQLLVIVLTNTDESVATTLARGVAGFYFKGGN